MCVSSAQDMCGIRIEQVVNMNEHIKSHHQANRQNKSINGTGDTRVSA